MLFVGILLVIILLGLFSWRSQLYLGLLLARNQSRIWFLPLLCLLLFVIIGDSVNLQSAILYGSYFTLPCLSVWLAKKYPKYAGLFLCISIFAVWLPVDFRVFNKYCGAHSWPLLSITSSIIMVMLWRIWYNFPGMKISFQTTKHDGLVTTSTLGVLAGILIPLGLWTQFLAVRDMHTAPPIFVPQIMEYLWRQTYIPSTLLESLAIAAYMILVFIGILATIALPEELLFRSIIQNWWQQYVGNRWLALSLASIIFGAAHLNNNASSWYPSQWNWTYMCMATIAGLGYGFVFQKTKSLLYPAALHAAVDTIWQTWFV